MRTWDSKKVEKFVLSNLSRVNEDLMDRKELERFRANKVHGKAFLLGTEIEFWEKRKHSLGTAYELCELVKGLRDEPDWKPVVTSDVPDVSDPILLVPQTISSSPPRSSPEPEFRHSATELVAKMREQAGREKWDVTEFSNSQNVFQIPFPYIGPEDTRERLSLSEDNFPTMLFMGRTIFKKFYEDIMKRGTRNTRFYYGTEGYGKSRILASMAALMLVKGKRVVYIPNCGDIAGSDPLRQIRRALYIAFHDRPVMQVQITNLTSAQDFIHFCAAYKKNLYFIFDQYDALEETDYPISSSTSNATHPTVTPERKSMLRQLLTDMSYGYKRVFCSSANHMSFRLVQQAVESNNYLEIVGGYDEEELKGWWKYQASILDVVKEFIKSPAKKQHFENVTGRVPLYLDRAIRQLPTYIEGVRGTYKRIIDFARDFKQKFSNNPEFIDQYYYNLEICLRGSTTSNPDVVCLDHRFFYYDRAAKKITAVAEFVMRAARRILNERSLHLLSLEDYLEMIHNMAGNVSMIGFAAEGAIISAIHISGLTPSAARGEYKVQLKKIVAATFNNKFPHFSFDLEGTRMYIPGQYNYPAIDFLLIQQKGTAQTGDLTAKFLAFQVTLNYESHSDSERLFFRKWADWESQFLLAGAQVKEIYFVWVTPKGPSSKKVAKDELGFNHPEFLRLFVPFSEVNMGGDLDAALRAVDAYGKQKSRKRIESSDSPDPVPSIGLSMMAASTSTTAASTGPARVSASSGSDRTMAMEDKTDNKRPVPGTSTSDNGEASKRTKVGPTKTTKNTTPKKTVTETATKSTRKRGGKNT